MLSSITSNNKAVIALTAVQIITAKDLHQMIRLVFVNVTNVVYSRVSIIFDNTSISKKVYVTYRIRNFKAVCLEHYKSYGKNLHLIGHYICSLLKLFSLKVSKFLEYNVYV